MEASRQLSLPIVHEVIEIREIDPKDDFGYPQLPDHLSGQRRLFNYRLGWHSNDVEWVEVANAITKAPEGAVCAAMGPAIMSGNSLPPDYTKQLQFHEYELSQAEKRHMPPAQVAYHFNRLCLLRKMGVSYE